MHGGRSINGNESRATGAGMEHDDQWTSSEESEILISDKSNN